MKLTAVFILAMIVYVAPYAYAVANSVQSLTLALLH
jgi:hypothetical protein